MEVRRMKPFAALPLLALSAPALAHSGHLAEQAGHSHYLGLAALGAACVVAVVAIARGVARRRRVAE
jgi:hypothetical protein